MKNVTRIKNGSRYEENGWIRVSVKGAPYDMGYANGYLLAPELKEVFKMLDFRMMNDYGYSREFFSEVIAELFRKQIQEGYPEFYREIEGIAAGAKAGGAKVSLDDMLMWNCYMSIDYMVAFFPSLITENPVLNAKYGHLFKAETADSGVKTHPSAEGGGKDKCTGFMAVGSYTKDGKIVCGHNTFDNFIDAQFL